MIYKYLIIINTAQNPPSSFSSWEKTVAITTNPLSTRLLPLPLPPAIARRPTPLSPVFAHWVATAIRRLREMAAEQVIKRRVRKDQVRSKIVIKFQCIILESIFDI